MPIFDGEELIGALAVVFFAAGLSVDAAVERYLAPIQEVSRTIRANLAAGEMPGPVGD
ncbi:hypothetical protein MBENS4_1105 [Novosphingobium sp. MBES04]|nr:hypothetical protein MBENS4_1105 [Novosphingobium sp. MBES04]